VKQHLLLRKSRDFESVEAYEAWLQAILEKANRLRDDRFQEELAVMRPLEVTRLPEYTTEDPTVTSWSTIRIKYNAYSVPSRLIGEVLRVRVYDDRLEVYYGNVHQFTAERLHGRHGHRIDYRHIIWSLVRKPGGFARYVYREEMFPSLAFREAYDQIQAARPGTKGDLEYLRILHLAASTMESEVVTALALLKLGGKPVTAAAVRELVTAPTPIDVPALASTPVDLAEYDALLVEEVAA
jgi:hypothetical protein